MRRFTNTLPLISCLILAPTLHAQLRDSGQGKATAKKGPKTTIVVRPGPPVKPTQTAKPNGQQKSDWGTSASAQR